MVDFHMDFHKIASFKTYSVLLWQPLVQLQWSFTILHAQPKST